MTLALQHSLSGSSMSFSWAIALFSTFLYTVGALRVAALIFRNEAIRLGEQSGVDAFRAQSNADEVLPWGEALVVFGVIAALLLYGGQGIQRLSMPAGILLTPVLFLFLPAWGWSRFRGIRTWSAQGIRRTKGALIGASVLLGFEPGPLFSHQSCG